MIKATNMRHGISVKMSGDTIDLLEELTAIIRGVRANFDDAYGEELSRVFIAQAGKLAFADSEEEREAVMEETAQLLETDERVEILN